MRIVLCGLHNRVVAQYYNELMFTCEHPLKSPCFGTNVQHMQSNSCARIVFDTSASKMSLQLGAVVSLKLKKMFEKVRLDQGSLVSS